MSTPNPVTTARSAVAVAVRLGRDATAQRRRLATEKAKRAIQEALTAEHPPTDEQRQELIEVLTGGGSK